MQEEFGAVEALNAQRDSLQLLVSELLVENQNLRQKIAKLTQQHGLSAPATHPQPRQDR